MPEKLADLTADSLAIQQVQPEALPTAKAYARERAGMHAARDVKQGSIDIALAPEVAFDQGVPTNSDKAEVPDGSFDPLELCPHERNNPATPPPRPVLPKAPIRRTLQQPLAAEG